MWWMYHDKCLKRFVGTNSRYVTTDIRRNLTKTVRITCIGITSSDLPNTVHEHPDKYKVVQIWPGLIICILHTNQSRSYLNHLVLCELLILEGYLTVHFTHEIMWNTNLMHLGNFIDVFLARHVSGAYAHHQEH